MAATVLGRLTIEFPIEPFDEAILALPNCDVQNAPLTQPGIVLGTVPLPTPAPSRATQSNEILGAGELEVQAFEQRGQTTEEFEANKRILRDGFQLAITAKGHDGKELYGTVEEVFESPNFPENLTVLYVNSSIQLRSQNYVPRNQVEMYLDFVRPHPLDLLVRTRRARSRYLGSK